MAEIVNLKRVKKARARTEKEAAADANRAMHGTPKRERDLAKARAELSQSRLDAHKKDR